MACGKDSDYTAIPLEEDSPASDDAFLISDRDDVCIYRVPTELSRATPAVFTPQILLIGPLQGAKKKSLRKLQNWKYPEVQHLKDRYDMYQNMEDQKVNYMEDFKVRVDKSVLNKINNYIKDNETKIRRSYAESTAKIQTTEFVNMINQDAIFIIELFLKGYEKEIMQWSGDILIDDLQDIIYEDLILLENQLPFFLLEGIYQLIQEFVPPYPGSQRMEKPTFYDLTLKFFGIKYLPKNTTFRHFTELMRAQRVLMVQPSGDESKEQFSGDARRDYRKSELLYNVKKLQQSGIDFVLADPRKELSSKVEFESSRKLKIGRIVVDNSTEKILRNIIALESTHYLRNRYVSSYVKLLALLVDTDEDVALLKDEGIIRDSARYQGSVVDMINRLSNGLEFQSRYSDIETAIENHYKSSWKRTFGMLRRNYFPNILTGTASVVAVIVVVLGFIDTVSSILQLRQH